jgi:hypothetical protein
MIVDGAFGEVIARRELLVENDAASKVVLEIAKPISDGQDYGCAYRISYRGLEKARTIFGVDAFQALQLALNTLAVDLAHSDWLPVRQMHWLEPGAGTGFVEPKSKAE